MPEYQLVLQIPEDAVLDFDAMVAIEDELSSALSPEHDVDGHDIGSGTINYFVITKAPGKAFSLAKTIFVERGLLSNLRAASRRRDAGKYELVWPENDETPFKLM